MQNYQEIMSDRRDTAAPQRNHGRLYRILFAVQIISVLIIIGCGLAATGSFG